MRRPKSQRAPGRPGISVQTREQILELSRDRPGQTRSQREIARLVGVAQGTVARVLQNQERPSSTAPATESAVDPPSLETNGVTLRTVALEAKVSLSTASLALRHSPRVAPLTRQKVEQTARSLGYRVHPYVGAQLAAVRRGRIKQIQAELAYLYWGKSTWEQEMSLPFGPARQFRAAEEKAKEQGYRLEVFPLYQQNMSEQELESVLKNRGIQGLILDLPAYAARDSQFRFDHFSSVALGELDRVKTHVVGHDQFLDGLIAFCQLWLLGYRRICLLNNDTVSLCTLFSYEAAFTLCQNHLLPVDQRIPILPIESLSVNLRHFLTHQKLPACRHRHDEHDWLRRQPWKKLLPKSGKRDQPPRVQRVILQRWLEEYQPDALICDDRRVYDDLESLGLRIPQDIALVHSNVNTDVAGWSGIRHKDEEIGAAAVELLLHHINLGEMGLPTYPKHMKYEGEWVEGHTTRRLKRPTLPLTETAQRWINRILARRYPTA